MRIKIILWAVLALALCAGCRSKQKMTERKETVTNWTQQQRGRVVEATEYAASGKAGSETAGSRESREEAGAVTRVTEYDTSKPVDTLTGRCPVIRETETVTGSRRQEKESVNVKETAEQRLASRSARVAEANGEIQASGRENLETSRKKKTQGFPWVWIAVGGAIAVICCVKLKINKFK